MNVLFISTHGEGFGGSEYLWFLTAKEAIKCGHQVYVAVNPSLYSTNQLQKLQSQGAGLIKQNSIDSSSFFGKIKFKIKKHFPNWFRVFKDVPFGIIDFVCISQAGTYDICRFDDLVSVLEKQNLPFSLISQYHDEHGCLEEWKYRKARKIFPMAKKFYFVSKRNKGLCELLIAKKLGKAVVINNPFRFSVNRPLDYPDIESTIHFACVARLDVRVKCQNILLNILSEDAWKSRAWHLDLYGEGKDEAYLKDLIVHLKLNARVTLHGQVEDIKAVWQKSHLFLLPSIGEGIPLSLIEAFGFGRPAVVTDVGGNDQLVEDGLTGILAASYNQKNFEIALEKMWGLKHHWSEMGRNAFDRLHQTFVTSPQKQILKEMSCND
jgi:glycosyltransferase involved in cell wall biosynthesis